jgi:hypothetical protein
MPSEELPKSHEIAERQTYNAKLAIWWCSGIGLVCIVLGFYLVLEGATGGFNIGVDLKGVKGYFASLAPGLLFVACGVVVIWAGVRGGFRYVIPFQGGDIKVEAGGRH